MEISQIFHGQQTAVFLVEFHHLLGNLTLVEEISGRLNRFFSAFGGVLLFDFNQAPKAAGQVFLDQNLALFEGTATGVEDLSGGRPHGLFIGLVGNPVASGLGKIRSQGRGNGEAAIRQFHGGGDNLLKGHGSVEFQGGQPSVGSRGGHGAGDTGWQVAAIFGQVVVNVGCLGPTTQTANLHGLVLLGIMDDDGGHAAKVGPLGQHYVERDTRSDTGVGGVTTLLQNTVSGCCGQIVTGRDHVGRPGNCGTVRLYSNCHVVPPERL